LHAKKEKGKKRVAELKNKELAYFTKIKTRIKKKKLKEIRTF
jgi:hypothetical protein